VLDELVKFDQRYTWSSDGDTINVYPRVTVRSSDYLPNRAIDKVSFSSLDSADDILGPLSRALPGQQMGYAQTGGDPSYGTPWSGSFSAITVRQLMNRAAEGLGSHSTWILSGSRGQRFFTFEKGGFHTPS